MGCLYLPGSGQVLVTLNVISQILQKHFHEDQFKIARSFEAKSLSNQIEFLSQYVDDCNVFRSVDTIEDLVENTTSLRNAFIAQYNCEEEFVERFEPQFLTLKREGLRSVV